MNDTLRATPGAAQRIGLVFLLVTSIGWGINWPMMKLLLREWPPLFARGTAGMIAALAIALIAAARGERLAVPPAVVPRLLSASAVNVLVWMGASTLALQWVSAAEGALLVYTMPVWAMLLAWPLRGVRPRPAGVLALLLGLGGVATILGGQGFALGLQKLPGVLLALAAAVLFALGTVAWRSPLPLPPLASVAWQVGIGCLPMLVYGLLFEARRLAPLSGVGWTAMVYMTVVPMGLCYLSWFAALRRLPPAKASIVTLVTPVVGVAAAAVILGEPFGLRETLALTLTLAGVALALRRT